MHTSPRRRRRAAALAPVVALSLGFAALTSSCSVVVPWRLGKTHGLVIEHGAVRASLAIYRVPTKGLSDLRHAVGLRSVQEVLWSKGQPPKISTTFVLAGRRVSVKWGAVTAAMRAYVHYLIYDRSGDLSSALTDARGHRACLALTLISAGRPTANWTYKRVGCIDGAIR